MSEDEIRAVTARLEKLMGDLRRNVRALENILNADTEEIDDEPATA